MFLIKHKVYEHTKSQILDRENEKDINDFRFEPVTLKNESLGQEKHSKLTLGSGLCRILWI